MVEYLIMKVIAIDGERKVVPSDQEEMHRFIVEGIRPEFEDSHVLSVKFLLCTDIEDTDPEETSWFINPEYCKRPAFACSHGYGPRMDSSFIPELFLINQPGKDIFKKYESFHTTLLIEGLTELSDNEKLDIFLSKLETID